MNTPRIVTAAALATLSVPVSAYAHVHAADPGEALVTATEQPTTGTSTPQPVQGTSDPEPTRGSSTPQPYATFTGTPKTGTGGIILRDRNANPIGSGIWENGRFDFAGTCIRVAGIDYVKITQHPTPGTLDGYGNAYTGYGLRSAMNLPPTMPC